MEPIRSVARAADVIDAVYQGGPKGARLVDIVAATGLQKTTAHRIVSTLVEIGWLDHIDRTGEFHLGFPLVGLGTAALNRYGLLDIANPHLMLLAEETGDTVYLCVRSGADALYVDRVTGHFPIRTLIVDVGDRRPLGVGAGSLALLSWLPEDEAELILRRSTTITDFPGHTADSISRAICVSRDAGYAVNVGGVVPGANGVGVPVMGSDDRPVAALSVSAVEHRLSGHRISAVAELIQRTAVNLAQDITAIASNSSESSVRRLLHYRE